MHLWVLTNCTCVCKESGLVSGPSCVFQCYARKIRRPCRFYDVMMMYWTRFGMQFKISTNSPTQQNYLGLKLSTKSTKTLMMLCTLSCRGELFVHHLKVYGIPSLLCAPWTGSY